MRSVTTLGSMKLRLLSGDSKQKIPARTSQLIPTPSIMKIDVCVNHSRCQAAAHYWEQLTRARLPEYI